MESNFALEIALGQEQASAAEEILKFAERGAITLAIPWLSVGEPFSTITQRSRTRRSVIGQLEGQLRDLRRSQSREEDVRGIELAPALLARIDYDETSNLILAAQRILNVATVLALDASVFGHAMEYRARLDFSPQDALVYRYFVDRAHEAS